jgi:hypothetical protein
MFEELCNQGKGFTKYGMLKLIKDGKFQNNTATRIFKGSSNGMRLNCNKPY